MTLALPGSLNGHSTGIIMKELVRRAINTIRNQRFIFEATAKLSYDGEMDDLVTSADKAAQTVYEKSLKECFPFYGIVGEENNLHIPCSLTDPHEYYFTVDPLDGTKAFARRQSHGVGTMIALVRDGEVIGAFIGDIMTQEIYGFRPGSNKVHRISEFDHAEELSIDPDKKLKDQYLLLRKAPSQYSGAVEVMVGKDAFRGIEVSGGSIGIMMARLWKGEVGAVILDKGHNTPWDWAPVLGITEQLNFVFIKIHPDGCGEFIEPTVSDETEKVDYETLIVHTSRLKEVRQFLTFRNKHDR
jgi:fructose-1,6-bisphosphatase/inositol monophosphatase family enzyme